MTSISKPLSIARVMNILLRDRWVKFGKLKRRHAPVSAFFASEILKIRSLFDFPSHNLSSNGRTCGKIGMAKPVDVLCRNVIMRPASRSTSARVSEPASAWPSPASPRNSRKSALACASALNCCARTSPTIALNWSNVGVSRIGFSRFAERRWAGGELAMILSRKAKEKTSLMHEICKFLDAAPKE